MSEQIYIGVDLGGTTVKVGICDKDGKLLHTYEGPTGVEDGADAVIDRIAEYSRKIVADSDYTWEQVAGVGAGLPGFLDIENGIMKLAPNLKWKNVPVRDKLQERLQVPIVLDNDANVAALGESWSGAGAGVSSMVCFTLGTGVGGGIIIDNKIVHGFNGMAGEIGHISVVPDLEAIQCGCGQMGCVETVSSATGIVRMAEDAVERGESTSLALEKKITAKDVFDAAKSDDEVAVRIIKRSALYLGKAMSTLAVILNAKCYIIGGGVSKAGDILFDALREEFGKITPEALQEGVDIIPAKLGNDAGMVGAAGLLLHR